MPSHTAADRRRRLREIEARVEARFQAGQQRFARPAGQEGVRLTLRGRIEPEEVREPDEILEPEPERPSALDLVFETHPALTQAAARASERITTPRLGESRLKAMLKGGFAGAVEGATSLLNPADITAAAFPVTRIAKAPSAIRTADTGFRAISALLAARGVGRGVAGVAEGDLGEAGRGVAEVALGALGARGPRVRRPERLRAVRQ